MINLGAVQLTLSQNLNRPRLSNRQERFVDEYLVDCNATRAAIAAGYSKKTAAQAGWEVLRNPKVAAEISRRQQKLAERHEVSADNVISELGKIAFASLGDFYDVRDDGRIELDMAMLADPIKAAALSQIEITEGADGKQIVKFRLADKRAALNDLGKHLGLFGERIDVALRTEAPTGEAMDVRSLALGALALLSAAAQKQREVPLPQLEAPKHVAPVDDIDLDD